MKKYNIGDILAFGPYTWRILDLKNETALVISETIIGQQPFNDSPGPTTWADCGLRRYLNSNFLETFSQDEQSRIIEATITNNDNPWYKSPGGEDTKDYIFLLSIEEVVCRYFGDSRKNLENPSPKQRYWFQRKDINNIKRQSSLDGESWWWWLRSPGRDNKRAVYIHGDGNVGIQGNGTHKYASNTIHPSSGDNAGGLRPAMWLRLYGYTDR